MIAVKNPAAEPEAPPRPRPAEPSARPGPGRITRASALVLLIAIVASIGTGAARGNAYVLQTKAAELHAHWAYMRDNGVPADELAGLERQWTQSQESRYWEAASAFWLPGGAEMLNTWQLASDEIWSRDVARFRADASLDEQQLHRALGAESFQERKGRLEALNAGVTPLDYATIRDAWNLQARLVPIDRAIAASVAGLLTEIQRAGALGIRSHP